ncbi:PREDICTED: centromere protein Q [Condylura cristata]|uniref:centromere protein Q n=1 Tax=Condylura cristata TaxID=143302 RepID=UPI000643A37C|nr:PREDICTED: centromere protein Q [Condylura cristata]
MSGKENTSKKKSQQLKKYLKRKIHEEETDLLEKEVRNTKKRNKKHLSSEETRQKDHTNLKQIKIAPNRRKNWQPLPKSSRELLQTMMEPIIIEILSKHRKEHDQIHYHLHDLKKRLLHQCDTLQVPPKTIKDLTNVSNLLKMERTQNRANEEGLALLQEEIDKIVETIESMTGSIQSLQNKIQILTSQVEEEEEKLKQVLQIGNTGELSLPRLSQKSLKVPTLQEEILTLIPNKNALLKDLDVLHNSPQMKNMLIFFEETYKRLDAFKRLDAIVT